MMIDKDMIIDICECQLDEHFRSHMWRGGLQCRKVHKLKAGTDGCMNSLYHEL